jgi:ADP-ribose pyrophosphatase
MFKTLASKVVHKNPYYSIVEKKFQLPNGKKYNYYISEGPNAVIIVPIKGNKIIFEKQFRFPIGKWSLELPCGSVEKDETFLKTAKKELEEETGYIAQKMKKICDFHPAPGRSKHTCRLFLAENLKFVGKKLEEPEFIETMELTKEEVYDLLKKGKITDGYTISALALARDLLFKK